MEPTPASPATGSAPSRYTWLWRPNLIAFISSACVMILELVAGRIIAPHVGVSLYTWTSVIGVVLAGISLGNYLGGRLADRWASLRLLGIIYLLGGLASLGILAVDKIDILAQVEWPLIAEILALITALFFLPSTILGTISPVVAKLAVRDLAKTGSTVGQIYAAGSVGSIVGTFATGFLLISWLGTHTIVWGVGLLLSLLGLIFLLADGLRHRDAASTKALWVISAALLLAGAVLPALRPQWLEGPCTRETNYFCIKVQEEEKEGHPVRVLILDRLVHSYTSLDDPTRLVYGYEKVYSEITAYQAQRIAGTAGIGMPSHVAAGATEAAGAIEAAGATEPASSHPEARPEPPIPMEPTPLGRQGGRLRALFIGGGGYTFPRYMEAVYPGSDIHVIEIDPGVTEVAHDMLGLSRDTQVVTYNEDARMFLERESTGAYDLIMGDAFNDYSVPYHLTTKEFNDRVRAWLAEDGLYVVNIIDGAWGRFLRAYVHTLRQTFRHVYLAPTIDSWREASRSTFVLFASDTPLDLAALEKVNDGNLLVTRQLLSSEQTDALLAEGRVVMLTDRYAPVDQMLAPVFRDQVPE